MDKKLNVKRFSEWIKLKEQLHFQSTFHRVNEGEIWWCAVGENVGVEINGKSETFARPVLILKKLSKYGFMGIPLTSQKHEGTWYVNFIFKNRQQTAVLAQARVFSVYRLYKRMGTIAGTDFKKIKDGLRNLYF